MALREEDRLKLDSIVQQMISNGESDEDIQFVVNDFKGKYDQPQEQYANISADIVGVSPPGEEATPADIPEGVVRTGLEAGGQVIGALAGAAGGTAIAPGPGTVAGGIAGGTAGYTAGREVGNYIYGTPEDETLAGNVGKGLLYSAVPVVVGKGIGAAGRALESTITGNAVVNLIKKHPILSSTVGGAATYEGLTKIGVPGEIAAIITGGVGLKGLSESRVAGGLREIYTKGELTRLQSQLTTAENQLQAELAKKAGSRVIGGRTSGAVSEQRALINNIKKSISELVENNTTSKQFTLTQITDAIDNGLSSIAAPPISIGVMNLLTGRLTNETEKENYTPEGSLLTTP